MPSVPWQNVQALRFLKMNGIKPGIDCKNVFGLLIKKQPDSFTDICMGLKVKKVWNML